MIAKTMTIINESGLHARPGAAFVKTCAKFKCKIQLFYGGKEFNPKSIINLMGAGIKKGAEIEVKCDGEDENEAIEAIEAAVNSGLGE